MSNKSRYAMLTVDTEALPKRAPADHVNRLIWGKHKNGTAGVREMCEIGDEFHAKHIFFVDMCGAYSYFNEIAEVIRWLDSNGQDVQLHAHPEYLPDDFWGQYGFKFRPKHMNQYNNNGKAEFVIKYFSKMISDITGKDILAFRAGSFRWNSSTMRALNKANIPLSFNNSMSACHQKQCVYSEPTNYPYLWSNGVIEVPVTERRILPIIGKEEWWVRMQYPESSYFRFRPWWRAFLPNTLSCDSDFFVFLIHSWSLLYWDENGYGVYRDDRRLEGYRKLLKKIAKDYDIITTQEFLDLYSKGKITATHTVDLAYAEVQPRGGERQVVHQ